MVCIHFPPSYTGSGEHAKFCFSNVYEYIQTSTHVGNKYHMSRFLKQTLVLTKSEHGTARLGSGLLGTNIKAMSAQLVGCCKSW